MRALDFWKAVTMDKANFLESLVSLLAQHRIRYCVIGGQAVNAYAEPLVSLDLDLVVEAEQIEKAITLLGPGIHVERFPHSVNLSSPGSKLRVQFQTDPRYFEFLERCSMREILELEVQVAAVEDVLRGKIWAASDPARRPSKQKKDLLDITRLLEAHPRLRSRVPADILERLL